MVEGDKNCEIINKTKGKVPTLPFVKIKNNILGKRYDLSIAFVSPAKSKKINRKYKKKDKPTNILSFPLSEKLGEIILQPNLIKKEAPNFKMNYTQFTKFLLIHGMLHLKGMQHGSTMEREEKKLLNKFS
ncbi:MAG: rRNA maturation RNase YbeY [Patescibacteria group bacterium]|nr:rRNA maturation RNase YbeY [Patescibacteria group bacterium]